MASCLFPDWGLMGGYGHTATGAGDVNIGIGVVKYAISMGIFCLYGEEISYSMREYEVTKE